MKSRILYLVMWVLFAAGLIVTVGGSHFVHKTKYQHLVTLGGLALSLAGGAYVTRKEPLKSLLKTKAAMWFLFLFNLTAAVAAILLLHGSERIQAAAGLGIVSLGAGAGLLKTVKAAPAGASRAPGQQDRFPHHDQGQRYSYSDQGQQYAPRHQGQQYSYSDQGQQYPSRHQGQQYPSRDQDQQYRWSDYGDSYR